MPITAPSESIARVLVAFGERVRGLPGAASRRLHFYQPDQSRAIELDAFVAAAAD
jgi:hypothetical protein